MTVNLKRVSDFISPTRHLRCALVNMKAPLGNINKAIVKFKRDEDRFRYPNGSYKNYKTTAQTLLDEIEEYEQISGLPCSPDYVEDCCGAECHSCVFSSTYNPVHIICCKRGCPKCPYHFGN